MSLYGDHVDRLKMNAEQLKIKIAALEKEAARLAAQPYSQSNPGAVMERRDVARDLRRVIKQLEEISRPVYTECTAACTQSEDPQTIAQER